MNMNDRLRRILRISLRLSSNKFPSEEDELYHIMRICGFQYDFINNFGMDLTQIKDFNNYIKAERRVLNENIQEHYMVLSTGEFTKMLLFKQEQTLYYHIKVDDVLLFSYVHLDSKGEWTFRNFMPGGKIELFDEILPFLWKVSE